MPLYYFQCPDKECAEVVRKIASTVEGLEVKCPKCEKACERTPKPPTTRIVETLDNGLMVKKVERLADAEQIHKDRANSDKPNDREVKV